jgi:hypothetical protein
MEFGGDLLLAEKIQCRWLGCLLGFCESGPEWLSGQKKAPAERSAGAFCNWSVRRSGERRI